MLKIGDKNSDVKIMQKMLNAVLNVRISIDGDFGKQTELAVRKFQEKEGLIVDGIYGYVTEAQLLSAYRELQTFTEKHGLVDFNLALPPDQYVTYPSKKIGITLHHTVSDGNPKSVRENWANDDRGRVATHFIIGRQYVNGNISLESLDGNIVQCIPLENYAYHIATTRMGYSTTHNAKVNSMYVGIELCSWGCLKYENGKFYDLSGRIEIPESQVCILDTPFRTFKYWHKYTDQQLLSLKNIVVWLNNELNLSLHTDLQLGIKDWFEMSWDALNFRRKLTTHTNFEAGKFDCFPQPELLKTIDEIYHTC